MERCSKQLKRSTFRFSPIGTMSPPSESDVVSSFPLTSAANSHQLTTSTGTLTSPPLHAASPLTLPLDLLEEILCRLPVKLLIQLQCICKSWKSLISDRKFAKKHLHMSKIFQHQHHLIVDTTTESGDIFLLDSPISSVLCNVSNPNITQPQLELPIPLRHDFEICSCDGIICITTVEGYAFLLNPSIRRFNLLPPLVNERKINTRSFYSFGYDHFSDVYKVAAISLFNDEVNVHTLGTDYWKRIGDFPYSHSICRPGVFVSGTVNWLAYDFSCSFRVIVSLDLEKESYQEVSQPDLEYDYWTLGVFRDCLCIFSSSDVFLNVWIMKEYGNKESWTKLYQIPYVENYGFYSYSKAVYISKDDQVLVDFHGFSNWKLVIYDSKNGIVKIPEIQNINGCMVPEVYVESLISPCS